MKDTTKEELIEFCKEYSYSIIAVCARIVASIVITGLLGLSFFGIVYKVSYWLSPENYLWIFFSVFWYSKDLSNFVLEKINDAIDKRQNTI